MRTSGNREYAGLEQELQGKDYEALLQGLQGKAPFFRRFDTWTDIVAFMRKGISQEPQKDEVLRPIFMTHRKDHDPRWRTVLLVIFWPGLESIHRRKRGWDPDPDERWQNLVWTFLKVICRIDVSRRPDRLVQKVINDTLHHLHDEYRRAWNAKALEIFPEDDNEFELLCGGEESIGYALVELRELQEMEIKKLRFHVEEGRISDSDFLLLVGTRVYGNSIADYAREAGLDYQVAKKRRQRAEAVIRQHEKYYA
jgi:hypothetical protein